MTDTKKILLPIVLIIGGIAFAVIMYMRTTQLVTRCTEQTSGIVSNVSTHRNSDSHKTKYKVTVDYKVNGNDYTNKFTSNKSISKGTEVSVKYNPNKPEEIYIEGVTKSANSFILSGGLFVIFGIILLVLRFKKSGREAGA